MKTLKGIGFWLVVLLLAAVAPPAGAATDRSAEVKAFAEALRSGDAAKRIEALKNITNSGLANPELYDPIAKELQTAHAVNPKDGLRVDEVSWMCKALASSGLPQYKKILREVASRANSEKISNYAWQSLGLVDFYASRNAQMAQETEETRGLSPELARLVNLLRSPDLRHKKDAARTISRSDIKETRVFEVVKSELVAGTKTGPWDPESIDAMCWLCKALAASGSPKYADVLQEVAAGTTNEKLAKQAMESLAMLR